MSTGKTTNALLDQLRKLLVEVQAGHRQPKAAATEALALVEAVAKKLGVPRRGGAEVEYVVEDAPNGLVLTEHRKGGRAYPFRCPESVYKAVAGVLAAHERALPLDELITEAAAVLGDPPPDFQVRVALRLWMHVDPPLVVRNRARYKSVDAKAFASATQRLWDGLRTS